MIAFIVSLNLLDISTSDFIVTCVGSYTYKLLAQHHIILIGIWRQMLLAFWSMKWSALEPPPGGQYGPNIALASLLPQAGPPVARGKEGCLAELPPDSSFGDLLGHTSPSPLPHHTLPYSEHVQPHKH